MATRKYSTNYREKEVSKIVGALDSGYSVSVIGPPSVGKSNLLKYLDQKREIDNPDDDPWNKYAPKRRYEGQIVAVPVDPNALLPPLPLSQGGDAARSWPGFELLIHRISITSALKPTLLRRQAPPELEDEINNQRKRFLSVHPEVTDFQDMLHGHMGLRYLETIVSAALESFSVQKSPIRIALILDEFERMLDTMPDYFFVALRSLRDRFKSQLMFVTLTRDNLQYLVARDFKPERKYVLEPFIELFNDNTVYLGPFNDDDAWDLVKNLERRSDPANDYAVGLLIRASGGFAGLLRAGFLHAKPLEGIPSSDNNRIAHAATRLVAERNVQIECETLLSGLRKEEVETLYSVVRRETELNEAAMKELIAKSLLSESTSGGVIQVLPPVLAAYIRLHSTPPATRPRSRPFDMPEMGSTQ